MQFNFYISVLYATKSLLFYFLLITRTIEKQYSNATHTVNKCLAIQAIGLIPYIIRNHVFKSQVPLFVKQTQKSVGKLCLV